MIGSIIKGQNSSYAIQKQIGEGGVGTVYKAKDIESGHYVAVKVLHSKRFITNDIQKTRFKTEIEHSLNVSSEFIVKGLDHGIIDDNNFLILEWMPNGTLQNLISNGDYDRDKLIAYTAQILKSFKDLKDQGLVHRDIKPNNILIGKDHRLKLSDLGITKNIDSDLYLTGTGDHLGSVLYITERQRFDPESASHRDDFYAICLVLYELLSRKRIHNKNISLKYLRPSIAPMSLSILIDRGMEDSDNWPEIYSEMISLIDIENEIINSRYTGSVFLPELIIKNAFGSVIKKMCRLLDNIEEPSIEAPERETLINSAIKIVRKSYENCVLEFDSLGIIPWISDSAEVEGDSHVLYFGVSFAGQAEEYLEKCDLREDVEDRLFGFLVVEPYLNAEFKFSWVSGKRLYIDDSYLPQNTFEKNITAIDDEIKLFLNQVGRGLAIGAALGAIDRINDFAIERAKEEL